MVLCISSHFIALLYVECQCSETCVAIGCRQTSQSHGADALYHFDLFCTGSCFQLRVGTSLGFIAKRSGTCAAKGWTVEALRSSLARPHRCTLISDQKLRYGGSFGQVSPRQSFVQTSRGRKSCQSRVCLKDIFLIFDDINNCLLCSGSTFIMRYAGKCFNAFPTYSAHFLNTVCISISISIGIIEGHLEAKLPTIWTDGKAEVGRVREEKGRKKIREEAGSVEKRSRCAER